MHQDHQVFLFRGILYTTWLFLACIIRIPTYAVSENTVEPIHIASMNLEKKSSDNSHTAESSSSQHPIDVVPITFNKITTSDIKTELPNHTSFETETKNNGLASEEASKETYASYSLAAEINNKRPSKKPRQVLPSIERLKAKTNELDHTNPVTHLKEISEKTDPHEDPDQRSSTNKFSNDNFVTSAFSPDENNNFHLKNYKHIIPQKINIKENTPPMPPHVGEYIFPNNPDFMKKVSRFLETSAQAIDYLKTKESFLDLKQEYESIEETNWPDDLLVEKEMLTQIFNALEIGIWTWGLNLTYSIPPLKANRHYYEEAIAFENYVVVYDSVLAKPLKENFMKEQRIYFQYAQYFWNKLNKSTQAWYEKQLKRKAKSKGFN